ncbi:hypothetical protein K7X08_026240 [Anisodus acutangulus]|uniref:Uncharacterized protein n=1 Tax=Anisodus acutangulus TaxID=402998 RepID=A0A9Q1N688_9SOLA|nr:hypothetical protein K7X08_026240 [Anisodus acutangulus]
MQCTFLNLHYIQKNLEDWQIKAQGSNAQKAYFMICSERTKCIFQWLSSTDKRLSRGKESKSDISERINLLSGLRYHLATFLAQIYMKVDKAGQELVKDPEKSLSSLLVDMNGLFLKLEASIGHFHAVRQRSSPVDESYSFPLIFEKLPEVNEEGLKTYQAAIVTIHRKPRRVTRYWISYTCGIVGISICSLWLLRHSSLVGSSGIDNWVREAKESTVSFWNDHVEQQLLQIRDDLFYTFRKRQKGAMEPEEVQLTADSLHRMLQAFTEQTKGEKPPVNPTDQEMLEIVMMRYEKELMHAIQNLFFLGAFSCPSYPGSEAEA